MVISRHKEENNPVITVDGVPLEMVDIFKYLGTLIVENAKTEVEIETEEMREKVRVGGDYIIKGNSNVCFNFLWIRYHPHGSLTNWDYSNDWERKNGLKINTTWTSDVGIATHIAE